MYDETTLPGGLYHPAVLSDGPLMHLAGQTARRGEEMVATGIVGDSVDLATARDCARQCVDNLLAHARRMLGDQAAAKKWRRLKGANQLPLVIEGVTFTDGVAENDTENRAA